MAQGTEGSYNELKLLAHNMPSISKTLTPADWMEARKRVAENQKNGYRLDGMPNNVSYMGVVPRRPAAAEVQKEPGRDEMKAALLAELEAYRKEQEKNAERDAEAVDHGEFERRAGQADAQAGGDGAAEEVACGDRKRGHADRRTAQEAGGSGGEGEHRPKARARVKEKQSGTRGPGRAAPTLMPEQEAAIYEEYAAGATVPQLREKYALSRHYIEVAVEVEGRRRGAEIFRKHASPTKPELSAEARREMFDQYGAGETVRGLAERYGTTHHHVEKILREETTRRGVDKPRRQGAPKQRLNAEQQAELYFEYVTTPITVEELAKKWHIGEVTAWRYMKKARLNGKGDCTCQEVNSRNSLMAQKMAERIVYPALGRWMKEQGMSLSKLSAKTGASRKVMYKWLIEGNSEGMTKSAIDALIELTGLGYQELFDKGNSVRGGGNALRMTNWRNNWQRRKRRCRCLWTGWEGLKNERL